VLEGAGWVGWIPLKNDGLYLGGDRYLIYKYVSLWSPCVTSRSKNAYEVLRSRTAIANCRADWPVPVLIAAAAAELWKYWLVMRNQKGFATAAEAVLLTLSAQMGSMCLYQRATAPPAWAGHRKATLSSKCFISK